MDVPEKLKKSIRDDEEETTAAVCHSRQDFLAEKKLEASSLVAEQDDLIQSIQWLLQKLKAELPVLDLRIEDAKYTVTNYYDDESSKEADIEDGQPRRGS